MQGLHLTADLHECQCDAVWLTDAAELHTRCDEFVRIAGLQGVGHVAHTFPESAHGVGGVTAAILLAESHLCVHTWPEIRGVTIDVYVCNFGGDYSAKAQQLMKSLIQMFQPTDAIRHEIHRGDLKARA